MYFASPSLVQPRAWAAPSGKLDEVRLTTIINEMWTAESGKEGTIIRALQQFIAVPDLSLAFTEGDAWAKAPYRAMDILLAAASELRKKWAGRCKTDDIIVKVYGSPDKPLHTETGRLARLQ